MGVLVQDKEIGQLTGAVVGGVTGGVSGGLTGNFMVPGGFGDVLGGCYGAGTGATAGAKGANMKNIRTHHGALTLPSTGCVEETRCVCCFLFLKYMVKKYSLSVSIFNLKYILRHGFTILPQLYKYIGVVKHLLQNIVNKYKNHKYVGCHFSLECLEKKANFLVFNYFVKSDSCQRQN